MTENPDIYPVRICLKRRQKRIIVSGMRLEIPPINFAENNRILKY